MYLVLLLLLSTMLSTTSTFGMDDNTPEYYRQIARQFLDNPHGSNPLNTMTLEEEQRVAGYILHDLIDGQTNNALDEANSEFVRRTQALAAELQAWQPSVQILYGLSSSSSQPMGAPLLSITRNGDTSEGPRLLENFRSERTVSEFMEPKQKKNTFSFTNVVSTFKNIGKSWYHFVFPLPTCPCVYQTDPSIQTKLDAAKKTFVSASQNISGFSHRSTSPFHAWLDERAHIALTAGNLMSEQDKLENLVGDHHWEDRKEIIKRMIAMGHANPNTITYQVMNGPLDEAFVHKDVAFTQYLLTRGANPDLGWKPYNLPISTKPAFVAWFAQHTRTPLTANSKVIGQSWYHSMAACCLYYYAYAKNGIFSIIPYNRQLLLTLTDRYYSKATNSPCQSALALVDTCYATAVDNLCITADTSKRCAVIKQFEEARKDLVVQIKATAPDKLKQFDQEYITNQLKKASECPVCWDHFSDHFNGSKAGAECTLSCKHSLCVTCFSKCQTACPVCRKAIN